MSQLGRGPCGRIALPANYARRAGFLTNAELMEFYGVSRSTINKWRLRVLAENAVDRATTESRIVCKMSTAKTIEAQDRFRAPSAEIANAAFIGALRRYAEQNDAAMLQAIRIATLAREARA